MERSVLNQSLLRVGARVSALLGLTALACGCGDGAAVEEPSPLYGEVPIEYPIDLWDADVEGETVLRVRVTEEGGVDSVEVVETSGYPAFDSAAVRGALQLRYSPARRNGRRISVWARVPVQFTKGET
ncbi:MAG: energy transducer TonB [Gemmatimonadota bacterium]|jgi:protein TonB